MRVGVGEASNPGPLSLSRLRRVGMEMRISSALRGGGDVDVVVSSDDDSVARVTEPALSIPTRDGWCWSGPGLDAKMVRPDTQNRITQAVLIASDAEEVEVPVVVGVPPVRPSVAVQDLLKLIVGTQARCSHAGRL